MKRRSERWCLMRTVAVNYASAGTSANGIELKAERRKPSGEKHGPSGISVGDGTIAGERNLQQCKTKSSINIS